MVKLIEQAKCSGCFACVQKCPRKCIEIKEDLLGNLYPHINRELCIECGQCENACPLINDKSLSFQKPFICYAAWDNDPVKRSSSASGGVASAFYESALKDGYKICGAVYTHGFKVTHIISSDSADIQLFRQSKYVFSDTLDIFKAVREELNVGNKVLFISLPCKIAGLLSFLGKRYSSLVTVDIVCHGTPPYKLLAEHIKEKDCKHQAEQLKFREDNAFMLCLTDQSGKCIYKKTGRRDTYLAAFLEALNYRESCYSCMFAKEQRISDITICDFWGLGKTEAWNHPYTGAVSAILINTEKGNSFFENHSQSLFYEKRNVEEAVRGNDQLNRPALRNPKNDVFKEIYLNKGFERAVLSCLSEEICAAEKRLRKSELRRTLRKLAGVFIKKYRSKSK